MEKLSIKKDWHKSFFKNSFYNPASPEALKRAEKEVNFILKKSKIKKGASVLDLCCGPGRHSLVFAEKGFKTTGVDFSKEYLREAEDKAKAKKLSMLLIKKDMREINFKEKFDLAVNLFTSFGYFIKKSDDLKTLRNLHKALKKGGKLFLDIINGDFIRKNYRHKHWEKIGKDYFLLEKTVLSKDKKTSVNEWIKIKNGKVSSGKFFVRLYGKKDISEILKKAGFKILFFYGNFEGKKLNADKNRLIVLAEKS